ncbi:MAG: hypothetical protein LAO22_20415 [Acidobacteriia bacterium]|nr:hypothetical protein [Terriglobia bacterium]
MSEEMTNHGQSGHGTGFEREDLSSRGVFVFMIGLAITGLVIYFIIVGMYSFLDKYERSQMTTASPLVATSGAASRVVTKDYIEKQFKDNGAPMLEDNERGQFSDFLMRQEKHLNSYGWVDENAGVAYIPIERAMELTVQRGLPVLPQGGATDAAGAASKAPATKAPVKR